MQIEYLNIGDYKLSNLTVNERKDYNVGKYGSILLNSLKTNKKSLYQELLIKDKLTDYLIDMDKYMNNRINHLTRILAEKENINEKIKEDDQLRWVGLMNNYKNIAEEIVLKEVINDDFSLSASNGFVLPPYKIQYKERL